MKSTQAGMTIMEVAVTVLIQAALTGLPGGYRY